jgi:hypothetical protein
LKGYDHVEIMEGRGGRKRKVRVEGGAFSLPGFVSGSPEIYIIIDGEGEHPYFFFGLSS